MLQTKYIVDDLPPLPLYEGVGLDIDPDKLLSFNPSFGHEYGFNNLGLRLDSYVLDSLDIRGWPISKVAGSEWTAALR